MIAHCSVVSEREEEAGEPEPVDDPEPVDEPEPPVEAGGLVEEPEPPPPPVRMKAPVVGWAVMLWRLDGRLEAGEICLLPITVEAEGSAGVAGWDTVPEVVAAARAMFAALAEAMAAAWSRFAVEFGFKMGIEPEVL